MKSFAQAHTQGVRIKTENCSLQSSCRQSFLYTTSQVPDLGDGGAPQERHECHATLGRWPSSPCLRTDCPLGLGDGGLRVDREASRCQGREAAAGLLRVSMFLMAKLPRCLGCLCSPPWA